MPEQTVPATGSTSPRRRKRSQNACTACRQQKLRCDASSRFPNACTRCSTRNLSCRVDPSFRRTSTRNRLQEVSKELEELRKRTRSTSGTPPMPDLPEVPEVPEVSEAPVFPVHDPAVLPRAIGDVELPGDGAIEGLFQEFYTHYHPHLPIVDTSVAVDVLWATCPFLFTTIICVASRRHAVHGGLHARLLVPLNQFLSDVAIRVNHMVIEEVVAAMLLLCMWPPSFRRQQEDGSWLRAGMATHLALQNGFHRLEQTTYFTWPESRLQNTAQRNRIWLGCFLVDYELSTKQGLPATIAPDYVIRNPPANLPAPFASHLNIAVTASKAQVALSNPLTPCGLVEPATRWSLIQLFDTELQSLLSASQRPWSRINDIQLLTARLQLYSFVLYDDVQAVVNSTDTAATTTQGFQLAIQIITLIAAAHKDGEFIYYPTTIIRPIVLASIWLLKLVASEALTQQRADVAKNHVREAHSLCTAMRVAPNDESERAAEFINTVTHLKDGKWGSGSVTTKSRMGQGLFYDAVREKKEHEINMGIIKGRNTIEARDSSGSEEEVDADAEGDDEDSTSEQPSQQDIQRQMDWPFLHDDFWTSFADPTGLALGGLGGMDMEQCHPELWNASTGVGHHSEGQIGQF
ncbi:hypothetical protein EDC01DRAFT_333305 [Geopyxis carbonaria]|nr:hypothetical protein EDC01DRAFT_333305 [Geopyxis carbonaria]